MERKPYPSDLTDEQWMLLEPTIPSARPGGRPRAVDMREVLNGILYLSRSGCSWRSLPHDLPPWPTVHDYYRRFRRGGVWESINDRLRERVRVAADRDAQPAAACIDSQSVKTTEKGGSTGSTPASGSRVASVT
jgi:putative transposase